MLEIGQVVFSKSGRDKGLPFVVTQVSGEYVFLVDGRLRKLNKPKKKKEKHVQRTYDIIEHIRLKLVSSDECTDSTCKGQGLMDSHIRDALLKYRNSCDTN